MKKVLILSPHTDDAELGCGGTIASLIEKGYKIFWLVFSTADESLPPDLPSDTLKNEFIQVMNILTFDDKNYMINNFRVRRLNEKRQEVLEILVQARNSFKPDIVIGPSLNDYHQDHMVVANEMIRAFKNSSSIISYELPWNNLTFSNQLFFRLNKKHIEKKISLLKCYNSQIIKQRHYFSDEYIYGLAKTRGVQCLSEYAEAFEVIRWIE